MAAAPRRTHGMEWPLSTPQVLAGGIQLAVTAATFVLFGVYARSDAVAIPVTLYAVCFAGVLFGWAYCEFLDPSLPGGIPVPCMAATQARERYCKLCGKTVMGLDHHCVWLNTCVGKRTYWAFFILATAGTFQHLLAVPLAISTATAWLAPGTPTAGPIAFATVICVLAAVGIGAFGSLWCFHVFLLTQRMGTYDWLVKRNAEMTEREIAKRAAQEEAKLRAQQQQQGTAGGAGGGAAAGHPWAALAAVGATGLPASASAASVGTSAISSLSGDRERRQQQQQAATAAAVVTVSQNGTAAVATTAGAVPGGGAPAAPAAAASAASVAVLSPTGRMSRVAAEEDAGAMLSPCTLREEAVDSEAEGGEEEEEEAGVHESARGGDVASASGQDALDISVHVAAQNAAAAASAAGAGDAAAGAPAAPAAAADASPPPHGETMTPHMVAAAESAVEGEGVVPTMLRSALGAVLSHTVADPRTSVEVPAHHHHAATDSAHATVPVAASAATGAAKAGGDGPAPAVELPTVAAAAAGAPADFDSAYYEAKRADAQ